jgi:hypothetical protein
LKPSAKLLAASTYCPETCFLINATYPFCVFRILLAQSS